VSAHEPIAVALVSDAVYPYHRGGKETRYHQLVTRLHDKLEITVYTMHWWPDRERTKHDHGVEYRAISPLFPLYRAGRRSVLEAVAFALACLRLLGRRFDVVEVDDVPHLPLFTLRLVTKLRRRPLVVTWYEVWGPEYWNNYLGRFAGTVAWWIERRAMRLPDQILAVSTATADRLREYVGDSLPISVIQPAIDLDRIAAVGCAASGEAADLLYVGRLLDHKGVHLLIDALKQLDAEQSLQLLVVGNGPERDRLVAQAAAAGLANRVHFRSDVADTDEIFALMKAAQVFVFPSVREGFGIAPLEALACGTAVVTTSHPDNNARQLVSRSDRGYLAEPTADAIAAAIRQALAKADQPKRPAEHWLNEFSWDAVAAAYRDALVATVSSHLSDRRRVSNRVGTSALARHG
jgi:glycosyltransferase involved in cell wall biosynthesis